ncbi:MAG: LacI family DNA-binding transcriptional regulator [Anaerolineales bacterium]|nr:LacI family DNA-binding transcriptional regulator [Anaerolineales bacterium]
MTSIKDVAKAAGVSTATVSRVLANNAPIKPETRERVLKAVSDLNYRPNLIARSLRIQKSMKIGLVVSDIRNPFFTAIGRAVEDTAHQNGYSVLMCNTDEDPDKEEMYLKLLYDENVAGVIFSPTQQFNISSQTYDQKMPFVIIDRSIDSKNVDMVLLDNVTAAYELTEHLIANGYKKLAGIFGDASTTGQERSKGFHKSLKEHDLSPAAVHFIAPRIQPAYETCMSLLGQPNRPDAIFTSNSLQTAGAYQAARDSKLKVPQDVAIVGFDDTIWGTLVDPPVTVIEQPTEEIGRTATELLFKRIQEPDRSPKTVILKGSLIARGSSLKGE